MNGVAAELRKGLPATAVIRLHPNQPKCEQKLAAGRGNDVLLAAVIHPPRGGEPRAIGTVLRDVLACYGVAEESEPYWMDAAEGLQTELTAAPASASC